MVDTRFCYVVSPNNIIRSQALDTLYTFMEGAARPNDTMYWTVQYTNRKVPQGIVRYQAVMPQLKASFGIRW